MGKCELCKLWLIERSFILLFYFLNVVFFFFDRELYLKNSTNDIYGNMNSPY